MKTTLKATLVATAIATLPLGSFAAGLGGLNVLSGLGQPLRAEIEVQATPEELRTLTARVAPPDAFVRANVGYSPIMATLNFSVETRGNRSVVRVTSDRPVNDPFLEMLVELNWAEGRLLRQYTFLLDPVELARPPVAAATIERPAAAPAVAPRPATAPAPATTVAGGQYRVARGDTLHRIATRNRPANTTVEQMMIALLRQNPAAFVDGNINRLRAGAILTMPDNSTVQGIAPADARREVVAQTTDFEAYRRGLATAVATRPAEPAPVETRQQAGQIVPRVAEPEAADLPRDRVEVSGAVAEGVDPDRVARLQALEEELSARERSLDEAYERLSELEQSIRDLQGLIELRNTALAQMQQQLAVAGLTATEVPPVVLPEVPVDVPGADLADLPDLEALLEDAEIAEEAPAEVAEAPAPTVEAGPVVAPAVEPPAETIEERPVAAPAPVPSPMAPQPTFLQTILEDPKLLAAGGGVLILLLGYAGYRVRQKRKAEEVLDTPSTLSEVPSAGHSVFGDKGGQSVDTGNSSMLHTDFSQSGLSAIDADEGVDPVAEADVYMAYGRDAQAEEILLDALKADSSRTPVYLKLLEIYAQRQSLRQFESVAADLYSRTGGRGADWEKAAELGRKLDPDNPLYRTGPLAGADVSEAKPPLPQSGAMSQAGAAAGTAVAAGLGGGLMATGTSGASAEQEPAPDATEDPSLAERSNELSELDFTTSLPVEPSDSQLKDTWTMPAGDMSRLDEAMEKGSAEEVSSALAKVGAKESPGDSEENTDFSVLDFDLGGDDQAAPARQTGGGDDNGPATEAQLSAFDEIDTPLDLDLELGDELSVPVDRKSLDETVVASQFDFEAAGDIADEAAQPQEFDLDLGDLSASPSDQRSFDETVSASQFDFDAAERKDDDSSDSSSGKMVDTSSVSGDGGDLDATVLADEYLRDAFEGERGAGDQPVVDLEETGFENSLLDFNFDLDTPETAPELNAEMPAVDLSNIDLDLDSELPEAVDAVTDGPPEAGGASVGMPSPEVLQEVDTKLDLARAYEEMGDKDGARELIDEVIKEGSPSQREAAQRLLDRLG
jgi:pilus assembly protein FimV